MFSYNASAPTGRWTNMRIPKDKVQKYEWMGFKMEDYT